MSEIIGIVIVVDIRNRWHSKKKKNLPLKIFEVFSSIVDIIQEILFIHIESKILKNFKYSIILIYSINKGINRYAGEYLSKLDTFVETLLCLRLGSNKNLHSLGSNFIDPQEIMMRNSTNRGITREASKKN